MAWPSPTATSRLLIATLLLPAALASCGRLSGGGGGASAEAKVVVLPPLAPAAPPSSATLVSAVPAEDRVLVSWVSENDELLLALFVSDDAATLYDGPPWVEALPGEGLIVTGFLPGEVRTLGLGVKPAPSALPAAAVSDDWVPSGAQLTVRFGTPVYVDAAAAPGGNGLSPASAYNDLLPALIDSLLGGGRNLWVAEGSYPPAALPGFPGSHVYAGFAPDFDLTTRDPDGHPTILPGVAGQPVLSASGAGLVIVDGATLDGRGLAAAGVQALDAPIELRSCSIVSTLGPGIRLKSVNTQDAQPVLVVACVSAGHGAEGLSLNGAFDIDVRASRFESNVQEGVDCCDLAVTHGRTARASFCDTRFAGNGTEGLDLDMVPALTGGAGRFEVTLRGCRFESNGAAGCLLDVDFDGPSGGQATLLLEGNRSRGNVGDGVHLDLDGPSHAWVAALAALGNGGDGLRLTSSAEAVLVVASDCDLSANGGAGARAAEGVGTLVLSRSLLAANALGGLVSELSPALAVSSLAWLQPDPFPGSRTHHSLALTEPALARLPLFYTRIDSWDAEAPSLLGVLAEPDGSGPLEIADDGVARTLVGLGAPGEILVDPAPDLVLPAAVLTAFGPGDDVIEDYRALPGGAADGSGMGAPGEPGTDLGPLAAPGIPGEPGNPPPPFRPASLEPSLGGSLASGDELVLTFAGGQPDPARVDATSVVVRDAGGDDVGASAFVLDGQLHVAPPVGGWPAGELVLELHAGLSSLDGRLLAAPLALPLTVSS